MAPTSLEAARAGLLGDRWVLIETEHQSAITVMRGPETSTLEIMHDAKQAPAADVRFIALVREDVDFLISSLDGGGRPSDTRLRQIRERLENSTKGPWKCYLESEGGLGGSNVITMDGSESDLYLILEGQTAPDAEWRFVALAHEELPSLLVAAGSAPRS